MAELKEEIRERYAERARQVAEQNVAASCCGPSGCCGPTQVEPNDVSARGLYDIDETGQLPKAAVLASLGCGNPTALAELHAGEVVLDLGSGGGIDVLLSARRVGPSGKTYGLDMTDEMLALARENQAKAGVTNTDYREKYGREIEQACGAQLPADVNLVGAFIRAAKPAA